MGRGKKSGGGNRKPGQKSPTQNGSGQGTYVVDKQLIPRIDNYAVHHSLEDTDTVADALRGAYKEYQRRPMSAFKQMVQKAINAIHARSMAFRQGRYSDEQHAAQRRGSKDGRHTKEGSSGDSGSDASSSEDDGSSSSSSSSSEDGYESGEGAGEAAASGAGARAMNASLLSMYSRPAMAASADDSHRAGPGPGSTAQHSTLTPGARSCSRDGPTKSTNQATACATTNGEGLPSSGGVGPKRPVTGKRRRSSPQSGPGSSPPAFAPPEVVAAAACRALASEKQAKLGSKQGGGVPGNSKSSDHHHQQQQQQQQRQQQPRCEAGECGEGREGRVASTGQDGIKLSTGPKPYLLLPSVEAPAASHQQHRQQQQNTVQHHQQQQNTLQHHHQQQSTIQHQHEQLLQPHPHTAVPPADAGVAAAVAAAMAAAATASTATATKASDAGGGLGGSHLGDTRQAADGGTGGVEGVLNAGGEAMEEDGGEEGALPPWRGEGGGPYGQSAKQGQGVAAMTPAAKTGGNGGRPTTAKKARRTAPTPVKSQGGGRSGGGQSAVTVARAVSYEDLGGVEDVLSEIRELIEYPLKHPEVYAWLGVEPPRGVLLQGPPGCGKTALANAIANECGVPFLRVSAPEIVSGMSGESEAKLRSLFQEAADVAPCIVFIDEIDAIAPKRESAQREMERRIVAQMLTCMDDLTAPPPASTDWENQDREAVPICSKHVVVIGASNRPDSLDPALRRAGRFDREIALGIPSEAARTKILQVITQRLRLEGNFDFKKVAKRTPGFVGADLMALVKEAAALAVTRIFSSIDDVRPGSSLVHTAQPATQPACVAGSAAQGNVHCAAGSTLGQLPAPAAVQASAPAAPPPGAAAVQTQGDVHGAAGSTLGQVPSAAAQVSSQAPAPAAGAVGGASAAAKGTESAAGAADMAIDDLAASAAPAAQASAQAAPAAVLTSAPALVPAPAGAAPVAAGVAPGACSAEPEAPMQGTAEGVAGHVNGSGGAQCAPAGCVAEPISSKRFGQGPLQAHELQGLAITMSDFEAAVNKVQPSVRREGFATTPDVTWEDVGSLDEVREELSFCITQPVMHPERFQALGLSSATGVLLYGPPGCGKTLVAKAVAHESGANFMSIKGPELLNKYVGESERAVRQLFSRARAAHPCVLFFDELDALAPRRGTDNNQAAERVVNQLLTEMDGIDGRLGVFLVAATNRPDMIDPALLRPGRLDKILYVPLPPPDGRAAILKALVRNTPLAPGVDIQSIGMSARCSGFSGADMAALVREACVLALKESMRIAARTGSCSVIPGSECSSDADKPCVHARHFEEALGRVMPSVSRKDQRCYDALRSRLRSSRGRLDLAEDTGTGAATGGHSAGAPAVNNHLERPFENLAVEQKQSVDPRNASDPRYNNAEGDNAEPSLAAS